MSAKGEVLAALDAFETANTKRVAAKRANSKAGRAAAQGLSRQALVMRERRQDPDIKRREKAAETAKDAALRRLAIAHPDEYQRLVNDERRKLHIPPYVPRSGRRPVISPTKDKRAPAVVRTPKPAAVQARCAHNMGLTKLPYGTFCASENGGCGAKIR